MSAALHSTCQMHSRTSLSSNIQARGRLDIQVCRRRVIVHSTEGVEDLLSRDRKEVKLVDAWSEKPAETKAVESQQPKQRSTLKSRKQRRLDIATASGESEMPEGSSRPKKCKDAIDLGLQLFQQKEFSQAIDMFNLALELPGNGAYRLPGSPREYSCPSDGEEHAALYNMACAYAQLGKKEAALTCLEAIIETGYDDLATIRADPDLKSIQGPQLEALLNKKDSLLSKVSSLWGSKKQEKVSDPNEDKPWILW